MVCRLWCSFIYWHLVIAYLPFRFWRHHLMDISQQSTDTSLSEVRQLIKLSESVGRNHFVKINCLRRSMVQKSLLERLGTKSHLVIGVKKNQEVFAAHCWLTYQNKIINDSKDTTSEYITLEKINANSSNIFKHF
ncbi:MAG: lasso peptide biosynthesis B2 protein [Paraglaciecola sp.]|uniref:lasso peptide biosynthesis B2 protein n=1 Tax=Paraglaciecola sp. TaxID=1920173 RepID=UPI0032970E19